MICSYCETENKTLICEFCGADLQAKRPSLKENPTYEEAEQSLPVLQTYHTYDLLLFLRYLREERSKAYNLMRSAQKGSELIKIDSDTLTFAEEQYRYYTARMKVIEGILIDRMGYKPKRVDDKLLASLEMKMKKEN